MHSVLIELIKSKLELMSCAEDVNVHVAETFKKCFYYACSEDNVDLLEESNLLKIESVIDFLYEELNTGHWSEVPVHVRHSYSSASFVKAILLLRRQDDEMRIKKALKTLDMGILLGAPLPSNQSLLKDSASYLTKMLNNLESDVNYKRESNEPYACSSKKHKDDNLTSNYFNVDCTEIITEKCPSLQHFNDKYFVPQVPVKITECMSHWPACIKWKDVDYLLEKAGERTVPVEIGSHYVDENWSQKLMTLNDFIRNYYIKNDSTGYIAQHNLFDQISDLRSDILIPEYCCLSRDYEDFSDPDINAWFGPKGTLSPLHFDPKDNLLAQVFGSKQIILFSPDDSPYLYPHDDTLLFNTSRVDPVSPNLSKFPLFQNAKMFKCLLSAGEILYMPPKWWHHVTALDKSFSVSFWWK